LNLGDSYAGSWGAQSRPNGNDIKSTLGGGSMLSARQIVEHPKTTHTGSLKNTPGCKAKDLIGIPWRVAFALQADGWYLRSDIIWHKPNPMPESVTDRPTKSHEYLFLLSKQERYFYNAEAIKEPVAPSQVGRVREDVIGGTSHVERGQHSAGGTYRTNGKHSSQDPQSAGRRIVENVARARAEGADHDSPFGDTRNRRSVWTVATTPYSGAHFATFPPALIEPCILAGSRLGDTVLDPFGGAGTTGLVADRLGRDSLLIELNPEYAELARNRISDDAPLFVEVTS
jgi:DNA modification methylase